jgi:uncharacterized protein YigE (DUF2233 family)
MMNWILTLIMIVLSWNNPAVTPVPIMDKIAGIIPYDGIEYNYFFTGNIDPENISLIPNFSQPKPAADIVREHGCIIGVNAGFYDKSYHPIGLFISNGEILSENKKNQLFNGYISVDRNFKLVISHEIPVNSLYAVQTGPLLIEESRILPLEMAKDKAARRMVFTRNREGDAVLISVFMPKAELLGPQLYDLPGLVKAISDKENLKIVSAINLDGGSASAFFDTKMLLEESQPVGSWWCVNVE